MDMGFQMMMLCDEVWVFTDDVISDENMDIFDFELSPEEMESIAYLDAGITSTPQMHAPFWTDNMSAF